MLSLFSYIVENQQSDYYSCNYSGLDKFFHGEFRNFFMQKNLKKVLGVDDLDALREWTHSADGFVSDRILEKLIAEMNPYYTNIINRLDRMWNKPLEVVDEDGFYAGVFFGFVRFKKEEDRVSVSMRRNHKAYADIRNDDDWFDIAIEDVIEDGFLGLIDEWLKGCSAAPFKHLLVVATTLEFYCGDSPRFYCGNSPNLKAMFLPRYTDLIFSLNNINEYRLHGFKKTSTDSELMITYISGLFMVIMMNQRKWLDVEDKHWGSSWEKKPPEFDSSSIPLMNGFIEKMFYFESQKTRAMAYDKIFSFNSYNGYDKYPASKLIERGVCFQRYKRILDLFGEDKQKLAYLFAVLNKRKRIDLDAIQDDYFAYKKQLSENPLEIKKLAFPSKSAFRHFFELDFILVFKIVDCCVHVQRGGEKDIETYWRNIVYYLQYNHSDGVGLSDKSYKVVKRHIVELCGNFTQNQITEEFPRKISKALDLIMQLSLSEDNSGVSELLDYLNGSKFNRKEDGRLVKSQKKNLYNLDKRMTLKHAMDLQYEWHLDAIEYEKQKNASEENYIRNEYKGLEPVDVVIEGIRFKVILRKSELRQEGLLLNTCVVTYHNKIKAGRYVVLAVTDTNNVSSRNKANAYTMGICLNMHGDISLDQVKGFTNYEPPKNIKRAANAFMAQCQRKNICLFSEHKK